MRHPALVLLVAYTFILSACGKVSYMGRSGMMSETEAMETLQYTPIADVVSSSGSSGALTLEEAINQALASGQVNLPRTARGAVNSNGGVDLTTLTQLLELLQSGQANNILGLATGLVNMNGGNAAATGSKLDAILQLLNAVAPIIATIAPQFAPIITAVTTIVPLVITFINLFKKPKTTAALYWYQPVAA